MVVAIIAILATIAVPAYQNFQVKARQKEAHALLSGYFIAAQAAKVEHGGYAGNFTAIGFSPAGELKYRVTVTDNSTNVQLGTSPTTNTCLNTAVATVCPNRTWTELVGNSANKQIGAISESDAGINTAVRANVKSQSFIVTASGFINPRSSKGGDAWATNHQKVMSNVVDGANETANTDVNTF